MTFLMLANGAVLFLDRKRVFQLFFAKVSLSAICLCLCATWIEHDQLFAFCLHVDIVVYKSVSRYFSSLRKWALGLTFMHRLPILLALTHISSGAFAMLTKLCYGCEVNRCGDRFVDAPAGRVLQLCISSLVPHASIYVVVTRTWSWVIHWYVFRILRV